MNQYDYDAVVIGAGFGGLGAALSLSESGLRVGLLEALNYPGGCASTFRRQGYAFESGATLFSGFAEGMYFDNLIKRHSMPVTIDWIDPLVEIRTPSWTLPVGRSRDALIESFIQLGVPEKPLREFFQKQRQVADILWSLFDDPDLLPPWDTRALLSHCRRLPQYSQLLAYVGRSLHQVLKRHDLHNSEPLVTFLNALCQITIQTNLRDAEAPFALATMDYYFRGTAHVRHGIGALATAMVDAFKGTGGTMHYTTRVKAMTKEPGGWYLKTNKRPIRSRFVLGNILPHAAEDLYPEMKSSRLSAVKSRLDDGWGAAMLYLVVNNSDELPAKATHIEAVANPALPFIEGNHIFASLSGLDDTGRAPDGQRTLTVSTHVPFRKYQEMSNEERATYIADIQETMRNTLHERAPEIVKDVVLTMPASPRTFERFTKRPLGRVGGIPRRVGLHHYRSITPMKVAENFYLVGDSAFPGQSTLACALGGQRAATALLRSLKRNALPVTTMTQTEQQASAPQHSP